MLNKKILLIVISLITSGLLIIGGVYFINKNILSKKEIGLNSSIILTSTDVNIAKDKIGLIGISIEKKDGILTITSLLEGKPAEQFGLKVGDKIIRIDGKLTENISVDEAVKMIKGKPDTEVVLTIRRNNENDREFIIKRTALKKLPSKICQDINTLSKIPEMELTELNNLPEFYSKVFWEKIPFDQQSDFGKYAIYLYLGNIIIDPPELCGQEWVARVGASTIEESNQIEDSFYQYYSSEFLKRGWNWKINVRGFEINGAAADGPTGGIWGYLKATKNELRTVVLSRDFSGQRKAVPDDDFFEFNCPCETEFRIFVSDIVSLDELIP